MNGVVFVKRRKNETKHWHTIYRLIKKRTIHTKNSIKLVSVHFNVHVHTHRDVCGCYIFMPQKNWLTFLYLAFISLVLFEITLHFLPLIPVIIWDAVLCIFCIWTIPDCGYTHSLEILHWSLLDVLACSTLDFSAKMKTSLNSIHSIHSFILKASYISYYALKLPGNFGIFHCSKVLWAWCFFFFFK